MTTQQLYLSYVGEILQKALEDAKIKTCAQAFQVNLQFPKLMGSIEESLQKTLEDAKIRISAERFSELVYWGIVEASKADFHKLRVSRFSYLKKSAMVRILIHLSEHDPMDERLLVQISEMMTTKKGVIMQLTAALAYGFRASDWETAWKINSLRCKPSEDPDEEFQEALEEEFRGILIGELRFDSDDLNLFVLHFWRGFSLGSLKTAWNGEVNRVKDIYNRIMRKLVCYFGSHELPTVFAQ